MAKYTKVEAVRMTLTLLKEHGIKHVVISPGGTNIPLVHGLQQDPFFHCYSVVDERSAMYFAIGLYLQFCEPIATTCTSAQATRNYIPGLTEAYYKHVPILAITHSKHDRYTYQECMQAPNQVSLPIDSIKKSFALPYIACSADRLICERMINDAILELTHNIPGPIQLNIPIIDNERLAFEEVELPKLRVINRYTYEQKWNVSLKNKKIMIVAGEHIAYTNSERVKVETFMKKHNAIIYTNHLSNLHSKKEFKGNLLLTAMTQNLFDEKYAPEILITIGGQTGDYSLFGKLANNKTLEHWRVSTEGNVVDTYDKLTKVFQCSTNEFFSRMSDIDTTTDHSYYETWKIAMNKLRIDDVKLPLSNIYVAQQLHNIIPAGSSMNYAILNSLRSWLLFPIDNSIHGYSPVAAFGIDGGMSIALGQAYTSDKLCFYVTGDLAFFYDMNCLGIRGLGKNIRIVLINNNLGVEFSLYGNPDKINLSTYISAENHNGSAEGWCKANNFKYLKAFTKDDIIKLSQEFVSESDQSIVMEVITKPEDESAALKAMIQANFCGTDVENRKEKLKKLLNITQINHIHTILGR